MKPRVLIAVGLMCSVLPVVHAQDGLRSASLPERPIASPPPGPDDLFRAKPDTYVPHPDRPPETGGAVIYGGFGPWWPSDGYRREHPGRRPGPSARDRDAAAGADRRADMPRRQEPEREAPVAPTPPPAPAPPPPPVARAQPKTFYVIPGCYAGDKPPSPAINCDRTKLRTIR